MKLKLISPIPPSVNHYLGHKARGNFVTVYVTKEGKEYKKKFAEYVRDEAVKQGWNWVLDPKQHFYVDMIFYFDRTDMDAGNYDKCLLDALTDTQLVWEDDKVACPRVNRVYYDRVNPRIELEIYPVEYIGIFDNRWQLNCFTEKCKTCARYTRNCSILNNAKDGIIQQEITDLVCDKYREKKMNKRST